MPTKVQAPQRIGEEEKELKRRDAAIGGQILQILGHPVELQRVDVRPLWEHHYRVNVLVGADAASVRVMHSYFLVTDSSGNIVTTTPKLSKSY